MKESMLQELYYGRFAPWERNPARSPEYIALMDKIDEIAAYYQKLLSPEEYKKLEKMQNLQLHANALQEADLFACAFCAGAQLMIDVFGYQGL